jgi:hypothetical protein
MLDIYIGYSMLDIRFSMFESVSSQHRVSRIELQIHRPNQSKQVFFLFGFDAEFHIDNFKK